jgi:hypothetical protein
MRTLLFLLEELSAKDLLQVLVPRLLGPASERVCCRYLTFEGKQDLERNIGPKIRGWRTPDTKFVILRDQDSGDCRTVKERLVALIPEARRSHCVVRVACRELESWFLGDWHAVAQAFERPTLANLSKKRKYLSPDTLGNPHQELQRHVPAFQKRDGARRIGPVLELQEGRNSSRSFQTFCAAIRRLAE